ncbi:MAG TPA: phospholipase D-like domain-containing protein [Candidatus Hypogeohydataceae bacterium YC41]
MKYILSIISVLLLCVESRAEVTTHFSPQRGVKNELLSHIQEAKTSIDIAAFQFTSGDFAEALLIARSRGVRVRILLDYREAQRPTSLVPFLREQSLEIKLVQGRMGGQMHHTFIIFDNKKVFTGSYSLTEYAEKFNYENALFLDEPQLVAKYESRFNELFGEPLAERPTPSASGGLPPKEEKKYFIGLSLHQVEQGLSEESTPTARDTLWKHCQGMYIRGEGKIIYIYPDLTRLTLSDQGIMVELAIEGSLPPLKEGQRINYTGRLIERPSKDKTFILDRGTLLIY